MYNDDDRNIYKNVKQFKIICLTKKYCVLAIKKLLSKKTEKKKQL